MDIFKLSIILSVIGLAVLALLSFYMEPPHTPIYEITPSAVGRPVTIIGNLVDDRDYTNVRILKVDDMSATDGRAEITVPVFFEMDLELNRGDRISVSGKVQLYKETLEVVPSGPRDIKKLS